MVGHRISADLKQDTDISWQKFLGKRPSKTWNMATTENPYQQLRIKADAFSTLLEAECLKNEHED